MKRLRKGKCTIGLGLVLSDLAMNYERVADHCSNIAVYMMQLNDTGLEEHSFTEQMDEKESAEFNKTRKMNLKQKYEIELKSGKKFAAQLLCCEFFVNQGKTYRKNKAGCIIIYL